MDTSNLNPQPSSVSQPANSPLTSIPISVSQSELQALRDEIGELKFLMKENQKMVHGIYKRIRLTSFVSIIKWVMLIAVTFGAFYYLKPVFEAVMKAYEGLGGVGTGPNGESIIELFKSI